MYRPAAPLVHAALCAACLIVAAPLHASPAQQGNTQPSGAQQNTAAPQSPAPSAAPNPFPSPSATPTPGPFGNGFGVVGFSMGNASGGVIPSPAATGNPPFPASNANGFFVDLAGRLSRVYTATLHFGDSTIHGADRPVLTFSDGSLYYTPSGGTFGLGIGYESLQRSSSTTSANEFGASAILLPDLRRHVSPYASVSYFPSAHTQGASAGITTFQAGVAFAVSRPGILIQLGYNGLSYPNPNTSPSTLGNAVLGLGASF